LTLVISPAIPHAVSSCAVTHSFVAQGEAKVTRYKGWLCGVVYEVHKESSDNDRMPETAVEELSRLFYSRRGMRERASMSMPKGEQSLRSAHPYYT